MYSIAATAALAFMLTAFVALYALYYTYDKILHAYLPVKIAVEAWREIKSQLPNATICMVEENAVRAVSTGSKTIYFSSAAIFNATIKGLRGELPFPLEGGAEFEGEVFIFYAHMFNWTLHGEVDWLKPATLIDAASEISKASIEGSLGDVAERLAAYVPPGFSLTGHLEGVLYRRGSVYTGTLTGSLTLLERQKMRCLGYYLNETFAPHIEAKLHIDDNSTEVYVYIPVDITK
ncbi:MAG: hypothetical protein ABWJ97_02890 [Thermoproteus sp.]